MTPISTIRNLGPAMEKAFAEVGIKSAEDLRALGPDAAYLRLLQIGKKPHFVAYFVLVLGLQDRAWNDFHPGEKAQLRARFDALKAEAAGAAEGAAHEKGRPQALEAALSHFGVIAAKPREGSA